MKILILDPEINVSHRISKDTSGGYGTGNDFGDTMVTKLLKKTLKLVHDWPAMFAVYSMSVLKKNGHEVDYKKKIPENYFQHRNGCNAGPASTARACRIQNSCMHDLNSEF